MPGTSALGRVVFGVWLQLFLRRKLNRDDELELEHPKRIAADYPRTEQLVILADRVATEISEDTEAIAAIRAVGGKPKDWKIAAAWIRSSPYAWEHRNRLRAARLLKAAADGDLPVPATSEQEALFRAVENFEAVPLTEGFAMLASEVPALNALEQRISASASEREWQDRDVGERIYEILGELSQLVGPQAPEGSPFIRSHAAFGCARVHLLGKAGLLNDDEPST